MSNKRKWVKKPICKDNLSKKETKDLLKTLYRVGLKKFRKANKQGKDLEIISGGYDYYY